MQATPRKTHKKTRSGCVQCKRRKVKVGKSDMADGLSLEYYISVWLIIYDSAHSLSVDVILFVGISLMV